MNNYNINGIIEAYDNAKSESTKGESTKGESTKGENIWVMFYQWMKRDSSDKPKQILLLDPTVNVMVMETDTELKTSNIKAQEELIKQKVIRETDAVNEVSDATDIPGMKTFKKNVIEIINGSTDNWYILTIYTTSNSKIYTLLVQTKTESLKAPETRDIFEPMSRDTPLPENNTTILADKVGTSMKEGIIDYANLVIIGNVEFDKLPYTQIASFPFYNDKVILHKLYLLSILFLKGMTHANETEGPFLSKDTQNNWGSISNLLQKWIGLYEYYQPTIPGTGIETVPETESVPDIKKQICTHVYELKRDKIITDLRDYLTDTKGVADPIIDKVQHIIETESTQHIKDFESQQENPTPPDSPRVGITIDEVEPESKQILNETDKPEIIDISETKIENREVTEKTLDVPNNKNNNENVPPIPPVSETLVPEPLVSEPLVSVPPVSDPDNELHMGIQLTSNEDVERHREGRRQLKNIPKPHADRRDGKPWRG